MTRRWPRSARGNRRTSAANTARSAQSRRGRGLVRRSTATSWRSTRSSTSLAEDVRHDSRTKPEHLPEDQVQQPQRHAGIMSDQRSPLVSDPGPTSGTPHDPEYGCPEPEWRWTGPAVADRPLGLCVNAPGARGSYARSVLQSPRYRPTAPRGSTRSSARRRPPPSYRSASVADQRKLPFIRRSASFLVDGRRFTAHRRPRSRLD